MSKLSLYTTFILISLFSLASAQVKIGDNHTDINPGSLLELESLNKGFLFTRVALDKDLSKWMLQGGSKADGMVVFNTNKDNPLGLYCWYNNQWNILSGSTSGGDNDSLSFDQSKRLLYDDGDETEIASGRVHSVADTTVLHGYLDMKLTTEGDIYYVQGDGIFIRNDIADATSVTEGFIFMSAVVSKGAILCNNSITSKSEKIGDYMEAEVNLYHKPDTAVLIKVEHPSTGGYYSFAIPNDWDNPVISLKTRTGNGGFYKLDNCWIVEHNVERNEQLYQIWTLDKPLTEAVMDPDCLFKIE